MTLMHKNIGDFYPLIHKVMNHKAPVLPYLSATKYEGKTTHIGSTLIKAFLPKAKIGALYRIEPGTDLAEVISINESEVLLLPFEHVSGMFYGQWLSYQDAEFKIRVGDALLGTIIDGIGRPLGHLSKAENLPFERSLFAPPPDPLLRRVIDKPFPMGVRVIDGLLTCGIGQRIGIFAGSGVGKSTLLGMICNGASADVIVLALIGERGREVNEFLSLLPPETREKSVLVVTTSEKPALERVKSAFTATTIAEYFRDQGKNVLLMMDSVTRYARAARDVGLAAGEPDIRGGFTPSVFSSLPKLLERAGPAEKGSITAIYTVLLESDNVNDPVADEVRSILDGHIVLTRELSEANHFPAIDVGLSASRVMHNVVTPEHLQAAAECKKLIATYKDIELLIRIGEYATGQDPVADRAIKNWNAIQSFRQQKINDICNYSQTINHLSRIII
ncbi:EscN/YscN/HrcN family type III secretion system ATPase [Salmonella enterica subsp. salamae]|uniref:protein-secreting ATPase n=3 Tax=Salmonella enterica TaxID=28901 RepID=A0A8F7YHS4_SALER|nr:type III secretion system ATPase SctN [Salmonella enterica]EAA4085123.1 EscN/YscN/HrcN family type III secretion system ATPase [Salmonella enterica subsp. salamae serovar Sofia]EBK2700554.1 EscN/YscN/HrcN family type III secretion system ATPase [Salmonella enterica subsp. enterica serovar Paratyphi B]ECC2863097.1 EscN/YscN/HrcN family type III secretion system ATPase [Salmonella enterica subsp. enterica]EDS8307755.1 EscN/YscN/HrcN family type III secretion system ATPase [Salmonella enterica 